MQRQGVLQQLQGLQLYKAAGGADLHVGSLSMAEELEADTRLHSTGTAAPLVGSSPGNPALCQPADAPL